jgi:hypothetical protein
MTERIPIVLNEKTKGIIVYAESKVRYDYSWISLIKGITGSIPVVERHISYNTEDKKFYIDDKKLRTGIMGLVGDYDFYIATDEEKKIIKDELKRRHIKFVKTLNKLIPR